MVKNIPAHFALIPVHFDISIVNVDVDPVVIRMPENGLCTYEHIPGDIQHEK